AGTRPLFARGTVDIVPVDVCREPLREAILKRYATLKAGCRALGLSYRLVAHDRGKRGIRRDTLEYVAERLESPALQSLVDPAMGIQVVPPDVNVSAVQFSVAGDTVRFGLAAIKNVGEAAMQSILKARSGEGSFQTLEDFCARVDLRLVNRRVVESLIKAGAFDSLGLTRAHLLATTDAALESGQRQQRDQAEGQGSFFELLPAPPARPGGPVAEVMPE